MIIPGLNEMKKKIMSDLVLRMPAEGLNSLGASPSAATVMTLCGQLHYSDVIMGVMVSQITSLTIAYSTIYSGTDQRKHQSSASPAFVRGSHHWPVNSPHRWPVMPKIFHLMTSSCVCEITNLSYYCLNTIHIYGIMPINMWLLQNNQFI